MTIPWLERKNGTLTETLNTIDDAKPDIDANKNIVVLCYRDIESPEERSLLETVTGIEYTTSCKEHTIYGEESVTILKNQMEYG